MVDNHLQIGAGNLKLRTLVCSPVNLPSLCMEYEDLVQKQHEVVGVGEKNRVVLRHQSMVWQLINVLFSESSHIQDEMEDEVEEVCEIAKRSLDSPDHSAELFLRRADFSSWLQDNVGHLVDEELGQLKGNKYLKQIFTFLTGRKLDEAVEKAIGSGDVRLSTLLSQAGGPVDIRTDIATQLEVWASEDLDQSLIETDRTAIYKLLAGECF